MGDHMKPITFPKLTLPDLGSRVAPTLGHPLIDDHLESVHARLRPNSTLAVVYDLKVFFTVIDIDPLDALTPMSRMPDLALPDEDGTAVDMRCLVAGRWAGVGESSGVDVGGDTTSERGEASAVDRHGGRVELESLG